MFWVGAAFGFFAGMQQVRLVAAFGFANWQVLNHRAVFLGVPVLN